MSSWPSSRSVASERARVTRRRSTPSNARSSRSERGAAPRRASRAAQRPPPLDQLLQRLFLALNVRQAVELGFAAILGFALQQRALGGQACAAREHQDQVRKLRGPRMKRGQIFLVKEAGRIPFDAFGDLV